MDNFKLYARGDVLAYVNERKGEQKLGQHVQVVDHLDKIAVATVKFVVLGIPEDIGIRANHGVGGARTAWKAAMKALLNIQHNTFLIGEEILVLGEFEITEPSDQSISSLRAKTAQIDSLVFPIIQKIVLAGKIPIIIGGGHNNALPIIQGVSAALNQSINVLNIDAHADLRPTAEGRHSGNGFSAAFEYGYLNEYRVFGLHQNYVHESLPSTIAKNSKISAFYFDELLKSTKPMLENWKDFVSGLPLPCGLEIDVDSIADALSSAATPSGFTLNDVRKFLLNWSKAFSYLHICEGAAMLDDGRTDADMGKLISYLITDFIKALPPRTALRP